jgi:hypothetical protein
MQVKLLVVYNVRPHREEEYYRFMMGEFLPAAQSVGLIMAEGWHTAYGDYPDRLFAFVAENEDTVFEVLRSERWRTIEEKLVLLVTGYETRIVAERAGFQFFHPSGDRN